MDDVCGQVLIAAGDEYLAAAEAETAVRLRFGAGADNPQIGAGMGLGQAHGTGPAAFVHRWQVTAFEGFAGVGIDGKASTAGERRIKGKTGVCAVEHFFKLHGEHFRHAQAAKFRIARQAYPAAFDVGVVG